jgi:hypothetical protein
MHMRIMRLSLEVDGAYIFYLHLGLGTQSRSGPRRAVHGYSM